MKYSFLKRGHLAILAIAVSLTACGGGGGGGDTTATNTPSSTATTTAPAAGSLSVQINGVSRTADADGNIAINPGDAVSIASREPTGWTSSPVAGALFTLGIKLIDGRSWAATVLNRLTTSGTLNVRATSLNGPGTSINFVVGAGDARNGSYTVFAANGTRQTLALNFDGLSYEMTDAASQTTSGTLAADTTEAGTFRMVSIRNAGSAANTARLRTTTDTVVGTFPFANAYASPVSYSVQPFVASRALVTTQSALDGTYNRLAIRMTSTGRDSLISQIRVRNAGTFLDACNDPVVYTVATCPAGSVRTYAVTPATTAGTWNGINVADATDTGSFSIATIGSQNVYLDAGTVSATTVPTVQFRIGTPEGAFNNVTVRGGSTDGAWGSAAITDTSFGSTGVLPTNAGTTASLALLAAGVSGPAGMRAGQAGNNAGYWLSQGGKLGVMVGARNNLATQGFLQLGLID